LSNLVDNCSDLRLNYQIIDVREPDELQAVNLPGNDILNLPLSSSGEWAAKIVEGFHSY
jgi:rhodanese-related sulfurtransferase